MNMKMIQKKMTQILACSLVLLILGCIFPAVRAEAVSYKVPFDVSSRTAYLVNLDTGDVIFEKDADKQIYPASLTKIMTAILVLENVSDLEGTMVTAPAYCYNEFAGIQTSTADIRRGETVSMLDLLYALMLPSACEAGNIIADYIGDGSIPAFVDMMNAKALTLGAVNTHFENPHGLFNEKQLSTARDMYLITRYALELPLFEKICSTTRYTMPESPRYPNNSWYIHTTNKMMVEGSSSYYPYIRGIKTGSLPEVGKNFVSTASKDGYRYLLVTMGAADRDSEGNLQNMAFTDARNLYDWAFEKFALKTIVKKDDVLDEVQVELSSEQDYVTLVAEQDVTALLPSDTDASTVQKNFVLAQNVQAPVKKGDVLGRMELMIADEHFATVNLVAMEKVDRSFWLYLVDVTSRFFHKSSTQLLLGVMGLAFLLYLIFVVRWNKVKQRRRARRSAYREDNRRR